MVQIADVNKLKCKFVREWAKYLHNRKYDTTYCFEKTYEYFKDFKLATTLIDCLEYEDECALSYDASLLPNEPDNNSVSINCAEQATITTTVTSESCTYTPSASIDGQAKMKYTLVNNSTSQHREVNLYVTSSCGNNVVLDETYSDNNAAYQTGHSITGAKNMINGYLFVLVLYKTDINGDLTDSAIFIDTSPSSVHKSGPLWVIDPSDLYFTSSNYTSALGKLIDNTLLSMYGTDDILYKNFYFDSSGNLFLFTRVKHNPTGEWMGINTDNGKHTYKYFNGSNLITVSNTVTGKALAYSLTHPFFFSTPCTTVNEATLHSNGQLLFVPVALNFNRITLTSSAYSVHPLYVSAAKTVCITYTLKGFYTTSETVLSVKWYSGETVVSNTFKYVTSVPGEYIFEVTLATGCSYFSTVTI